MQKMRSAILWIMQHIELIMIVTIFFMCALAIFSLFQID